ncbi:beta-ketoacyl reductase, partial [Chitinophaga varians]|uniref:beta-ketoacyl reductase n=1 Tax=Chitinophaga varians TaxID=2202339 RepID=UPI00165F659C
MKSALVKIYQDIFNRKLSRQEALEKIRAVKQQESAAEGMLLAHPVWEPALTAVSPVASLPSYQQHYVLLCEMPAAQEQELRALLPQSHVQALSAGETSAVATQYDVYALACFELIRNILNSKPTGKILLQLVVAGGEVPSLPAGIAGLLKTAALENPLLTGQVLMTELQLTAAALVLQLQESSSRPQDTAVKYEDGIRYTQHWKELTPEHLPAVPFKDQGVYLITGGLGGLGLVFAKEILRQTTRSRIILTGRATLTPAKKSILDALPVLDQQVEYRQLNISDREEVKRLIADISTVDKPLNGILHCAGMIADNFIIKKSGDEFTHVLSPKVTGTVNLDEATSDTDLDFLVLFSSVTSLMGNVGQGDYAAANGFMDQFAAYRNQQVTAGRRRGHTLSVNWPLWQDGGMQIGTEGREILRHTFGMQPMAASTGMYAFYHSLEQGYSQTLVMEGNLAQMRKTLLEDHPAPQYTIPAALPAAVTPPAGNPEEKTIAYLCMQFAAVLKLAPHKIDPQAPLEKYGIDSILAMSLTAELEKTFGTLPKTLFFEYQTVQELAAYFMASHTARLSQSLAAGEPQQQITTASQPGNVVPATSGRRKGRNAFKAAAHPFHNEPIAIIGLSGRYPQSADIDAYWRNLRDGKDCITEVPSSRW